MSLLKGVHLSEGIMYIQVSMELGFESTSLLERCSLFDRCISEIVMYRPQWSWDLKMCPYKRGVLISEGVIYASMELGPKQVSHWSKVMTSLTVSDLKYSSPLNGSNVHHLRLQPVLSLPVL